MTPAQKRCHGTLHNPLVAEPIEQAGRAHFWCAMGKRCCLLYHFSVSKLTFLPFHIITFVSFWAGEAPDLHKELCPGSHGGTAPRLPFLPSQFK